ncbi:phage baseplate assembly protein V [Caecibacteroides pullorum]|uniref:Gp5/Type VI secretion system Vgr protein OB-fold domain-containing protein n=1 Tax=Caecibacteroides pullorum TaxID=2725562 RepID=A0AA41D8J0_9BACT|nr:phage baseplate assembly protein V [Caecibacteroides pullorum]MBM6857808.1 hypothetical protein [Caecibacteroides pullorum]MBV8058364.1 hypothetical protein [Caecibacteroides pullorum]
MASYTLTIYDIPQIINKKYISISYNSNGEKSTCTIHTENRTWICTLQDLSYSKAIYKPGELIFKLQITGCSGVNAICSTFKGKKIELTAQADNKSSSIAKDYYIFGIQIEKKGNVYYATFQAYDPFKFLTLDTYCKAYTGKKFTQDIFLNKDLWPNNLPETIDEQLTIENAQSLKKEREAEKANLEEKQKEINKEINDLNDKINKETNENTKEKLQKTLNEKEALSQNISIRIQELDSEIKKLNSIINDGTKSQFNKNPRYLYYNDKEFIQPYLVQYNESFFDFLVRVSNRCGEFLYYEDGYFNIGWEKKTKKDKDDKEQDDITPITEYVSVNFSDETATAWKENYIVSSHHNYSLRENKVKRFPSELQDNENIQLQDSQLASDENLVSLPPKDEYTKWQDFALWPGYFFINAVTDIVNSADMIEAAVNLISDTGITILNCSLSAKATNDDYEDKNFKKGIYTDDRKNGDRIHPFSTSESVKNALDSYVTFSLEFYEAVRKGIEANERSRIQIALGDHFYPLTLGSLIELDGEQYIVVQMNGCANSGAETFDIEAIPYKENEFVFPPAAPVGPIREAKAQRAFITHNTDPLKMNRVRVRYPWQGQTEDPTPWIRIALPMASDGSGFNFLPQIGDEAIINYENGNIEKPYVEGMLYTRAAKEDESTVPYAFKRDKARVISSVNGHSIIFSDPSASSDALNSLSPLMSTIKSFCPTGFIKTELSLRDHKVDIFPDSFKKAMGGIEFTDEHGLYSISMSSDKRAISIDSPLGKVNISAFTGITISAPNGNVRIEGKNIDIVAGNNLSISSGNNIVSHFWPTSVQLLKESLKDTAVNVLKKIQPIDMGLIRTFMETLIRPIGGTMLIKSNRYLCIEAGKGEAKIPGRNLQLRRTALWTGGVKHKETASFFGDIVAAHQFIIDLFNTCKANTIAIGTMIDKYNQRCRPYAILQQPGGLSRDPDDSDTLLGNFVANQEYQPLKVQNRGTKDFLNLFSIAMHINDMAKGLYKSVRKSVWNNVKESLSKSLSDPCKTALYALDGNISTLCEEVYFLNAQNAYNSNFNANATINKIELRSVIRQFINNLNGNNPYGITVNLPAQIAGYDDANWNAAIQGITITNSQQQVELDVPLTTGLKRRFVKAWGLNGFYDQYNWDHASGGDILFSRKEDQTLFLDNNTINEYTLANKMQQIIDFLRNI